MRPVPMMASRSKDFDNAIGAAKPALSASAVITATDTTVRLLVSLHDIPHSFLSAFCRLVCNGICRANKHVHRNAQLHFFGWIDISCFRLSVRQPVVKQLQELLPRSLTNTSNSIASDCFTPFGAQTRRSNSLWSSSGRRFWSSVLARSVNATDMAWNFAGSAADGMYKRDRTRKVPLPISTTTPILLSSSSMSAAGTSPVYRRTNSQKLRRPGGASKVTS